VHSCAMAATAAPPARVLVVDDEDNITFLLTTALRHFGFAVDTAADGRSALQLARTGGHDVILLDVMLAVRDALAVEPDRPITLQASPVTVDGDEARLRRRSATCSRTRGCTPRPAPRCRCRWATATAGVSSRSPSPVPAT